MLNSLGRLNIFEYPAWPNETVNVKVFACYYRTKRVTGFALMLGSFGDKGITDN